MDLQLIRVDSGNPRSEKDSGETFGFELRPSSESLCRSQLMAESFLQMLSPASLMWILLGTLLGIVGGAIPGLTGAMLIALCLPLTFSMTGLDALSLLVSMYVGAVSGGLISATLLNMPGTPASMITVLDGHPISKAGRPGRALGLGICASLAGGLISWVFLVLLSGPMAQWSTRLGPFEMFALVMMAMALMASVSGDSLLKGLFSGMLGIVATFPGVSPASGEIRWTLGIAELDDGLKLLPVLIGLFAVSQAFLQSSSNAAAQRIPGITWSQLFLTLKDWKNQAINILRSSIIGTWIGILPGIGANVGSLVAYSTARQFSDKPEDFGKGSEEGLIASESANNATVGGALIPLVALGIPGSVVDAILLGGMVIHGLQPGPLLFDQNPEIVHGIMATFFIANLAMAAFMFSGARWIARLASVPKRWLIPVILVFCVLGSYALANRMFDVWIMLIFGLVGIWMERWRIPPAPFVIGFVLAPLAEENLAAGLMSSGGSWSPLVTRPISLIFVLLGLSIVAWGLRRHPGSKENRDSPEGD